MPKRKYEKMARPRSGSSKRSRSTGSKSQNADSPIQRLGLAALGWFKGPAGQQIVSLTLIAFGIVTFITLIPGINSGALIGAWARFLVFAFGWAAYPVAGMITGLGLLWLRHLVHQATAWRWRPFLGFELALLGLQTLTYALINRQSWQMVESGKGGGVVGWALYLLFTDYFGSLITKILMGLVVIVGIALAFDLTRKDLQVLGHRLSEVWAAWQADRTARAAERAAAREAARRAKAFEETYSPATGVAVSPIARQQADEETASAPSIRSSKKKVRTPPSLSRSRRGKTTDARVPLSLLEGSTTVGMNPEEINQKKRIIERTLKEFLGVDVQVTEVRPGPTVTQFGVSPEGHGLEQRRVRVSQIAALSDDLALALAARSLRVQAPVPGRAVVGIEVPNADISLVRLRPVLESDAFRKCGRPLCFALGLDVAGEPHVADLSRMPHLLVAGTTGSGKSVFVKALAASLVMHNSPEELRLIAIDPKMVELSHLNGLPHLLGSAETEVESGLRVLRWVAHEMDERYKLFARAVARNLDDYNARLARRRTTSQDEDEEEEPLPRIVVLIDELADLMMSEAEETERTLTRIAQMARATGIHLVVATQRPSTDVVTGLIKANFPARVSFATASGVDSRVIIDGPGAETLLGRGDMLFMAPDASAPTRIQGCYISDEELEAIIRFWQKEAGATQAKAPWEVISERKGPEHWRIEGLEEDADLLEQAIAYATSREKVSTSGIQRRLHISYPRAARLMEQMEKMGLVGPQVSAGRKRRVILGDDEE
ncbi:MAG: DNA translocase FtsK 4TM domain-containing protein [Anaerolineae bacterium]